MIDFFQICYHPSQLEKCYPFAKVVMNDEGYPFYQKSITYFENAVICDVVPNSTADLISVASWRLQAKRNDGPCPIILKNKLELSEEIINSKDFDVAVLTPRKHQDIRFKLIMWHTDIENKVFNVEPALKEFDKFFKIPEQVDNIIYENHFIAKGDLYKEYVNTCLAPAISFMEGKEIFQSNSGYIHKKRNRSEVEAYQRKSGRVDWPIAPFILERLFCSWIQGKGLKVINL